MPSSWNIDIAGQLGQPGGAPGAPGGLGPSYIGTSTTNLPINTGSVTISTQAGMAYVVGARMRMSSNSDPTQWMEGAITAYSGTSMTVNVDLTSASAPATQNPIWPACGRLVLGSAPSPSSTLKFIPFKGDRIKINGNIYAIPAAGITSSYTNVYVNGVAGQTLVNNTFYFIYLFNNAGVLTFDFSTTAHVTSQTGGNVGVEIKSGDDTRSLIGILNNASGSTPFFDQPQYRYIRSWFNRPHSPFYSAANWGPGGGGQWTATGEVVYFVAFADDLIHISHGGQTQNNTAGTNNGLGILLDGSLSGYSATVSMQYANSYYTQTSEFTANITNEGILHSAQGVYGVSSGAMTGNTALVGSII
jgi:hypothetical protein